MKKILLIALVFMNVLAGCALLPSEIAKRAAEHEKEEAERVQIDESNKEILAKLGMKYCSFGKKLYAGSGEKIVDNNPALYIRLAQYADHDKFPQIGCIVSSLNQFRVIQQTNGGTLISYTAHLPGYNYKTFIYYIDKNEVDSNLVSDQYIDGFYKTESTYTYETASGGSNTVFRLKRLKFPDAEAIDNKYIPDIYRLRSVEYVK